LNLISVEEPRRRSSRKPIAIIVGAIVAMIVVAFVGIQFSTTSDGSGDEGAGPTSVNDSQVTIDIQGYAYHPSNISVPRGAKVTWLNDDNQDHTATEKDNGSWNTQIVHNGQSETIEFDSPGTFAYYCTIHPYMVGTLTVR
jgi:plastocyanin